jgi:hypothetical protein
LNLLIAAVNLAVSSPGRSMTLRIISLTFKNRTETVQNHGHDRPPLDIEFSAGRSWCFLQSSSEIDWQAGFFCGVLHGQKWFHSLIGWVLAPGRR